jgi:hypothetical protein
MSETLAYEKVVDLLKDQDGGSVTQRFCLAALQKTAFRCIKAGEMKLIDSTFISGKGLIEWLGKFLERQRMRKDVNQFAMQYASALLANLSSTKPALDYVQKNAKVAKDVLNIGLSMLKEKISSIVVYHLLLTFSHLCSVKEKLAGAFEETKFSDKLADFQEFYAQVNPNGKSSRC